jgi:hypothetical protein
MQLVNPRSYNDWAFGTLSTAVVMSGEAWLTSMESSMVQKKKDKEQSYRTRSSSLVLSLALSYISIVM